MIEEQLKEVEEEKTNQNEPTSDKDAQYCYSNVSFCDGNNSKSNLIMCTRNACVSFLHIDCLEIFLDQHEGVSSHKVGDWLEKHICMKCFTKELYKDSKTYKIGKDIEVTASLIPNQLVLCIKEEKNFNKKYER